MVNCDLLLNSGSKTLLNDGTTFVGLNDDTCLAPKFNCIVLLNTGQPVYLNDGVSVVFMNDDQCTEPWIEADGGTGGKNTKAIPKGVELDDTYAHPKKRRTLSGESFARIKLGVFAESKAKVKLTHKGKSILRGRR